jgi:putative tributyrin esterase
VHARVLAGAVGCAAVVAIAVGGLSAGPGMGARVVEGEFHSAAVNGPDHFATYLPSGYDSGRQRYPVVYFLHGLPAKDTTYKDDWIAKIGRSAERSGHPAIVVGAQGARAGDTDPEWHDWGTGRDWETATAGELVTYVDTHYRTIRDRGARALIGLSAGGYGATIIGLHHLSTFSVVQSWSGYFRATTPNGSSLDLGSRGKNLRANVRTYVGRARRAAVRYGSFHLSFYVGDQDALFAHENKRLHRRLVAAGVQHVYARYPGSHTPAFWDLHRDDWVATAVDLLTPPA